ncbi:MULTISPECIES: RNA ligase family protein [Halorussus]|uniref:RNA ligase family protein n=1 Tax=Halorussus TaxID=1070314 RepID=UPI00209E03EA|nr:RNA ligase family protein [Halorussus vallis]USZ74500.1 hypothetical protein NGM07_13735 [Halorussus vallis]
MRRYPSIPPIEDAPPELLDGGHLWIQERVDGAALRFELRDSGLLRFGDRTRVFDADEIPDAYRHAVRHVRKRFDRRALRDAVGDVESVTFFGVATHRRAIDYDWDRLPSFLGTDVWSEEKAAFLPPDSVEGIYERLGLDPVNAVAKEVRAVDFDPDSYEIPESAWYDGPAKGVVLRNKTGERATLPNPAFEDSEDRGPVETSAEEFAEAYATDDRFRAVVRELEAEGRTPDFDAVFECTVERAFREEHDRLFDEAAAFDSRAFRSEIAARARRFLDAEVAG